MDPSQKVCRQTLDCKHRRVRCVRFSVDGAYCLTGGEDRRIRLWNPHSGAALSTYAGHAGTVLDAVGSCDSSTIVSCGEDRSVILWDVTTQTTVRRYRGHAGPVYSVRFDQSSSVAVSGSADNSVMVWDPLSRRLDPIQVMKDSRDAVTAVCVEGSCIIAGSADGHVRCYDVRTGRMTSDCVGMGVASVATTRDSQCYLLSCADATVKLFDRDSGECLSTYDGHSSADISIECAVDIHDRHVVSGSITGHVFYWDLITGAVKARIMHTSGRPVHTISYHPTEEMLLSACDDTVKLWTLPQEDDEN